MQASPGLGVIQKLIDPSCDLFIERSAASADDELRPILNLCCADFKPIRLVAQIYHPIKMIK